MTRITGRIKRAIALLMAATMVICSSGITYAAGSDFVEETLIQSLNETEQVAENQDSDNSVPEKEADSADNVNTGTEKGEAGESKGDPDLSEKPDSDKGSVISDGIVSDDEGADSFDVQDDQDDTENEEEFAFGVAATKTYKIYVQRAKNYDIQYKIADDQHQILTGSVIEYSEGSLVEVVIAEKESSEYELKGATIKENSKAGIEFVPVDKDGRVILSNHDYSNKNITVTPQGPSVPFYQEFNIPIGSYLLDVEDISPDPYGVFEYTCNKDIVFRIREKYRGKIYKIIADFNDGSEELVYSSDKEDVPFGLYDSATGEIKYKTANETGFHLNAYIDETTYDVYNMEATEGQVEFFVTSDCTDMEEDIATPSVTFGGATIDKSAKTNKEACYILQMPTSTLTANISYKIAEGSTPYGIDIDGDYYAVGEEVTWDEDTNTVSLEYILDPDDYSEEEIPLIPINLEIEAPDPEDPKPQAEDICYIEPDYQECRVDERRNFHLCVTDRGKLTDDYTIEWEISDEDIATISNIGSDESNVENCNAEVRGLKPGEVTITAIVDYGGNKIEKCEAQLKVTDDTTYPFGPVENGTYHRTWECTGGGQEHVHDLTCYMEGWDYDNWNLVSYFAEPTRKEPVFIDYDEKNHVNKVTVNLTASGWKKLYENRSPGQSKFYVKVFGEAPSNGVSFYHADQTSNPFNDREEDFWNDYETTRNTLLGAYDYLNVSNLEERSFGFECAELVDNGGNIMLSPKNTYDVLFTYIWKDGTAEHNTYSFGESQTEGPEVIESWQAECGHKISTSIDLGPSNDIPKERITANTGNSAYGNKNDYAFGSLNYYVDRTAILADPNPGILKTMVALPESMQTNTALADFNGMDDAFSANFVQGQGVELTVDLKKVADRWSDRSSMSYYIKWKDKGTTIEERIQVCLLFEEPEKFLEDYGFSYVPMTRLTPNDELNGKNGFVIDEVNDGGQYSTHLETRFISGHMDFDPDTLFNEKTVNSRVMVQAPTPSSSDYVVRKGLSVGFGSGRVTNLTAEMIEKWKHAIDSRTDIFNADEIALWYQGVPRKTTLSLSSGYQDIYYQYKPEGDEAYEPGQYWFFKWFAYDKNDTTMSSPSEVIYEYTYITEGESLDPKYYDGTEPYLVGESSGRLDVEYFPQSGEWSDGRHAEYWRMEPEGTGKGAVTFEIPYPDDGGAAKKAASESQAAGYNPVTLLHYTDESHSQSNPVDCVATETGIQITTDNFSPFMILWEGGKTKVKGWYVANYANTVDVKYTFDDSADWKDVNRQSCWIDAKEDAQTLTVKAIPQTGHEGDCRGIVWYREDAEPILATKAEADGSYKFKLTDLSQDGTFVLIKPSMSLEGQFNMRFDNWEGKFKAGYLNEDGKEVEFIPENTPAVEYEEDETISFFFWDNEANEPATPSVLVAEYNDGTRKTIKSPDIKDGIYTYKPENTSGFCLYVYWYEPEYIYNYIGTLYDDTVDRLVYVNTSGKGQVRLDIPMEDINFMGYVKDSMVCTVPRTVDEIPFIINPDKDYCLKGGNINDMNLEYQTSGTVKYRVGYKDDKVVGDFRFGPEYQAIYIKRYDDKQDIIYKFDDENEWQDPSYTDNIIYIDPSKANVGFTVKELPKEGYEDYCRGFLWIDYQSGNKEFVTATDNEGNYVRHFSPEESVGMIRMFTPYSSLEGQFNMFYDDYKGKWQAGYLDKQDNFICWQSDTYAVDYEDGETIKFRFKFSDGEPKTPYAVVVEYNDWSKEVLTRDDPLSGFKDGALDYSPSKHCGFSVSVCWSEQEFIYKILDDEKEWADGYYVLEYTVGDHGSVDIANVRRRGTDGYGDYRVELERDKDVEISVDAQTGYYLKYAGLYLTDYADKLKDGKIIIPAEEINPDEYPSMDFGFASNQYEIRDWDRSKIDIKYLATDSETWKDLEWDTLFYDDGFGETYDEMTLKIEFKEEGDPEYRGVLIENEKNPQFIQRTEDPLEITLDLKNTTGSIWFVGNNTPLKNEYAVEYDSRDGLEVGFINGSSEFILLGNSVQPYAVNTPITFAFRKNNGETTTPVKPYKVVAYYRYEDKNEILDAADNDGKITYTPKYDDVLTIYVMWTEAEWNYATFGNDITGTESLIEIRYSGDASPRIEAIEQGSYVSHSGSAGNAGGQTVSGNQGSTGEYPFAEINGGIKYIIPRSTRQLRVITNPGNDYYCAYANVEDIDFDFQSDVEYFDIWLSGNKERYEGHIEYKEAEFFVRNFNENIELRYGNNKLNPWEDYSFKDFDSGNIKLELTVPKDQQFSGMMVFSKAEHNPYEEYAVGTDEVKWVRQTEDADIYELTISKEDFRMGFELELCTYARAFQGQYLVRYDTLDGAAAVYPGVSEKPYNNEEVRSFAVGNEITFRIKRPNSTYFEAMISQNGTGTQFIDIHNLVDDTFTYKCTSNEGITFNFFWDHLEKEFETIYADPQYRCLQYNISGEGEATVSEAYRYGKRWGSQHRVQLPREDDFVLHINPREGYCLKEVWYNGKNYAGQVKGGVLTISKDILGGEDYPYIELKFESFGKAHVYDYDDSKCTVKYKYEGEQGWTELHSADSTINFTKGEGTLYVRAEAKTGYLDEFKGIWGVTWNEESIYRSALAKEGVCEYVIDDFTCEHELHISDRNTPFENQYGISYDSGDNREAGHMDGESFVKYEGPASFVKKQEITFAFRKNGAYTNPFRVEINIPGEENLDVTDQVSDGKLSYTPASDKPFTVQVYWSDVEHEYDRIQQECNYETQYIVEIKNETGGLVDIKDDGQAYRHGRRFDRARALLPKAAKDITFVVTEEDGYVFDHAWINGEEFTALEEGGVINYHVNNPNGLYADFYFRESSFVEVYDYDGNCKLMLNGNEVHRERISYSVIDGNEVQFEYFVPKAYELAFTGINVYENGTSRVDQCRVGTSIGIATISSATEDGDNNKYMITLSKSGYPRGFYLELNNGPAAYGDEYQIDYDNINGTAAVKLFDSKVPLENNSIHAFTVGQEIKLTLDKPEGMLYAVEVRQKGAMPEVFTDIEGNVFSYTPKNHQGIRISVYWYEAEYKFEHITDDMDWSKYSLLRYEVSGNGNVTAGSFDQGKRWGNQYKAKIPRSVNSFDVTISPDEGYYLKHAYNNGTDIADQEKDGKLTILRSVLDTDDWFRFEFEPCKVIIFHNGEATKSQYVKENVATQLEKNTFAKKGHSFDYWSTDPDGSGINYNDMATVSTAENMDLYAQWKLGQYRVSFNKHGGTGDAAPIEVTYSETYGTLPTVTKEGYDFVGWYDKESGGTRIEADTKVTITADQELHAQWTAKEYTVTFKPQGGSVTPESKQVTFDATYSELPTPTRTGYTFNGWYDAETEGTLVTADTKVTKTENHNLYAYWTAKKYVVTFKPQGGSVTPLSKQVTFDATYSELPTPTRTGYEFDGWHDAATDGKKVTEKTTVATASDHNLYAYWTAEKCIVTFDPQGGSVTPTYKEVEYDSTYGELPTPGKTGYNFNGWYDAVTGGNKITSKEKVATTSDHTLYAQWTAITYSIKFIDMWGASGSMDDLPMTYDVEKKLPKNEFTKTGYSFEYWQATTTQATYSDEQTVCNLTDIDGRSISFLSFWIPNSYVVTFKTQGGEVSQATKSVTYDSTYGTLPTPERVGYTFDGWYDAAKDGNEVTEGTTVATTSNHDLYAYWTANEYEVTFDGNDGKTPDPTERTVTFDSAYGTLASTSRTGYDFAGWYTAATGGTEVTTQTTVATALDHTLYAHWTAKTYKVSFDKHGGEGAAEDKYVKYGSAFGTLPTVTKTGHGFDGWYTDAEGGMKIEDTTVLSTPSDQMLHAQWTVGKYTVSFNKHGGTGYAESIKVTFGDTYGTLPTLTKEGYDFDGWYDAETGGTKIESDTTVTIVTDQVLHAHWTAKKYEVTFKAQDGEVSKATMSVTFDAAYGELPTPTRTGYTFDGWYDAETEGTPVIASTIVKKASDHNLYAYWTANKYTVTFDAKGGSVTPLSKQVTYDATYSELPTPTRTGYKFDGWYDAETEGKKVTETSKVATASDHSLYAYWTAEKYTVTFKPQGGKVTPESKQVTFDATYSELPTPTKTGYDFDGWYDAETDGNEVTEETTVATASDHNLYAYWTAKKFTVTFDAKGGSVTPLSKQVTFGATYSELPTPTKEGYTFDGWYDAETKGTLVTADTVVAKAENHSLYAYWTANSYEVTFLAQGGEVSKATKSVTYDSAYGELPTPTKTGYTFDGWYDAETDGELVTALTIVKTASDHNLYAYWTAKSYEVTFKAQGGEVSKATMSVIYDATYSELPTPTRTGYTFDGWYDAETEGTLVIASTIVKKASDHNLYAYWTAKKYTVTFDAKGGSVTPVSKQVTYDATYSELPTPTRTGYKFDGWYDAETEGKKVIETSKVATASDHSLYAYWTAKKFTVTFDAKGGSVTPEKKQVTFDATYSELPTPTKTGYTFDGWYDAETDGKLVIASTTVKTASDHSLYAYWTANTYSIRFNRKSDASGEMDDQQLTYDAPMTQITANAFNKKGYSFAGWSKTDGGEVKYADKAFVQNLTASPNEIIDFYAVWTPNNYVVSFSAQGGEVTPATKSVTYDSTYGELPTPVRTGYEFVGWYDAATGGSQITKDSPVTKADDHVIYAHWEANAYEVTFKAQGGAVSKATMSVTYDAAYGELPAPTKTGHDFAGWYDAAEGGKLVIASTIVKTASDHDLYAYWTPKTYKVTLNKNGGTLKTALTSYTYGVETGLPTDITKEGFTFAGWYDDNVLFTNRIATISEGELGDKEYWAKWVEIEAKPTTVDTSSTQVGGENQKAKDAAETAKNSIAANTEVKKPAENLAESVDTNKTIERLNASGLNIEEEKIKEVSLNVKCEMDKIHADENGKIDKMEFQITPQITIKQDGKADVTEEVSDNDLNSDAAITFRIPIATNNNGQYAKVSHELSQGGTHEFLSKIKGIGANRYVEITVTEFSKFVLTFTDSFYSVDGIPAYTYTGSQICPDVVVRDGANVLTRNVDYVVTYGTNTAVGDGTVTVTILATGDVIDSTFKIAAKYKPSGKSTGGGGGGTVSATTKGLTYSKNWFTNAQGAWQIKDNNGVIVTSAWLCDNAVPGNGNNVWYLLNTDGTMMSAGLVQDNTGNFYSLETNHNGYFGSLRYKNGTYKCNGQDVYLEFEQSHNGSFGAVKNADGLEKLKAIYGVTRFGVNNSNCVYTASF